MSAPASTSASTSASRPCDAASNTRLSISWLIGCEIGTEFVRFVRSKERRLPQDASVLSERIAQFDAFTGNSHFADRSFMRRTSAFLDRNCFMDLPAVLE